jgi:hypothetical protein
MIFITAKWEASTDGKIEAGQTQVSWTAVPRTGEWFPIQRPKALMQIIRVEWIVYGWPVLILDPETRIDG